ncbi:MAG: TylF/MycF/NovP-related O-methyltransferase [Pseudomonadota bacterium]
MKKTGEHLYLDLLKKSLSYLLWEDPGMPVEMFAYKKPFHQRMLIHFISKTLRLFNCQAVKLAKHDDSHKSEGKIWPRYAETMIGLKRLDNIQFCVENVLKKNIKGDLIETGVWRGGATILMRAVLAAYGITDRRVFVADSFEGLPKPDEEKYPLDKGDQHYSEKFLAVTLEAVKANFDKYGLLDDQVVFLKGWFKDTLPDAPIDTLSVIRIDGDMYESTNDAIVNLYPKLSKGGYCIIDDYVHPPCKQAVDDYRKRENITSKIEKVDWTGVYWEK